MSAVVASPSIFPLTDQQRRALVVKDASVALSAGAGCGKTMVLTERFLAALKEWAADRGRRRAKNEGGGTRPNVNEAAMISQPLFCPYCNARVGHTEPLGVGTRLSCPRRARWRRSK